MIQRFHLTFIGFGYNKIRSYISQKKKTPERPTYRFGDTSTEQMALQSLNKVVMLAG